ncbi:uncharacterized protein J8A68_005004 [[Candida] subhashii]|uniref:Hyphally-regulated cell wall protein N-terminal domain-containing protein n=1 Tax=[Candida] subhashii TaxID=561895 RepID=A0A8J5UJT1_9ASCO|nr:uncharacterized protein J8A68_005004 [[Candida] subhashii]KAG7661426.1 hypothetical protein J8A68_005004 [[Candida] subhashii]
MNGLFNYGDFHIISSVSPVSFSFSFIHNEKTITIAAAKKGDLDVTAGSLSNFSDMYLVNVVFGAGSGYNFGRWCVDGSEMNVDTVFWADPSCMILHQSFFEMTFVPEGTICLDESVILAANPKGTPMVAGFGGNNVIKVGNADTDGISYDSTLLRIGDYQFEIGPGYDFDKFSFENDQSEANVLVISYPDPAGNGLGHECPCECDFDILPERAPQEEDFKTPSDDEGSTTQGYPETEETTAQVEPNTEEDTECYILNM